ncbi:ATP-binding domain-containing protein [Ruegeria arenilitoris]|uniref:ATP-binding domain-containing protein n=1 Tax=Ruegeria arenilitoris TaxID=1173585 RepID=UPI00147C62A1|nr:ATP-binding domain-containing protein [Ruegeria arenilitoris]
MSTYFNLSTLDAELTKIHRQDEGSVLELATSLRCGNGLKYGEHAEALILPYDQWQADVVKAPDVFAEAGFVIVDKHETRRKVNRAIRELHLNRMTYNPEPGDRLVICRNCAQTGLANGDVVEVSAVEWREDFNGYAVTSYTHQETGESFSGKTDAFAIPVNRLAQTYDQRPTKIFRDGLDKADLPMIPVDFGWAVTCHAAQGSERDNVIIIGNWMGGMDAESKARWMYTALTRARKHVLAYIVPLPPLPAWKARNSSIQAVS